MCRRTACGFCIPYADSRDILVDTWGACPVNWPQVSWWPSMWKSRTGKFLLRLDCTTFQEPSICLHYFGFLPAICGNRSVWRGFCLPSFQDVLCSGAILVLRPSWLPNGRTANSSFSVSATQLPNETCRSFLSHSSFPQSAWMSEASIPVFGAHSVHP
jgi:hypothetical protein